MFESRVRLRRAELLSKGTSYNFNAVINKDYTIDTVEHLIRYHWGVIDSYHDKDEQLLAIYCDITQAVSQLPEDEKKALTLMMRGYEIRNVNDGIAAAMGLPPDHATKLVKKAYAHVSAFLLTREKS